MSLYADEDLSTVQDNVPSTSTTSTTAGPSDPLQALASAVSCVPESQAQAEAFVAAGERFEANPEKLPDLCARLLPMVVDGGESLLRAWTLDMVALTVGRSALNVEIKEEVAETSLDALTKLVMSNSVKTIRAVIPIFSTIYPVLFKLLATSRPSQEIYNNFMTSRDRILGFVVNPNAQPQNVGIKAAAWKFVQKVLVAGTRGGSTDPRLQSKGQSMDPNINMITANSPLNYSQLDEEANMLRTQLITQLYSADDPAVLHAIMNVLPGLCKARPTLAPLIVSSITSWTPAAMENASRPRMQIRAVEKTLRTIMTHLIRYPALSAFAAQVKDSLVRSKTRMDEAHSLERSERKQRREGGAAGSLGKHPATAEAEAEAESSETAAKRAKMEPMDVQAADPQQSAPPPRMMPTTGREIDISPLPQQMVIDLVMRGLEAISAEALTHILNTNRAALLENRPDAIPLLRQALVSDAPGEVKDETNEDDEFLNPLDMDVDDDEDLLQLAAPDEDESQEVMFADFKLPPPAPLDATEKSGVVDTAVQRIWTSAKDLAGLPDLPASDAVKIAVQPKEIWMLLLARLATRGGEIDRKALCTYVAEDFATRSKFATVWLNEEWYNGKLGQVSHYATNLEAVVASYLPKVDAKDKALGAFLSTLPEITIPVIEILEGLCLDVERSIVGFLALREFAESRPPVRRQSLDILLQLCTHPDLKLRVMAISTVKRWVPGSPMSEEVIGYGVSVLERLTTTKSATAEITDGSGDVKMEVTESEDARQETIEAAAEADAEAKPDHPKLNEVQSRFLTEVTPDTVRQHVELIFALSRRQQDLLDHIFKAYTRMVPEIQDALESLLTPLIQSLGATPKLLDLLRHFPPGAEKLALRILSILSSAGASPVLVNVVKGLMGERDLDPKFVIPIIGQLDRAEIEKQIPKIVSLLGGTDSRDLVRNAFAAILQKMTPAELMVALHNEETSLKPTIEAIGICFSMTTVFRADVLANALQRIAELPTLPMIFMRTMIQTVTTYKSLGTFVANYVLPKLITKKIWTNPQLWDGFVRLARRIAPASYAALVQLPKEWLRDVVEKQPALKSGLKGFLAGKPGTKEVLDEIFGDGTPAPALAPVPVPETAAAE